MVLEDSFFDILKYKELDEYLEGRRQRSEEYVKRTKEEKEKENPKPKITRVPSKKRTKEEQKFYDKKREEFFETPTSSTRLRTKPLGTKERVSTSVPLERVLALVERKYLDSENQMHSTRKRYLVVN